MTEFRRILVPLDGSSQAEQALPMAVTLAIKFRSEIVLLRVLDIPVPTAPTWRPDVAQDWVQEARAQAHQEAQSYLEEKQQEIYQRGVQVRTLMRDRSPGEDILRAAESENVDLIVMSAQGRGGLSRWTLGSVADKVARHSPCPVLLVRYGVCEIVRAP